MQFFMSVDISHFPMIQRHYFEFIRCIAVELIGHHNADRYNRYRAKALNVKSLGLVSNDPGRI